MGVVDASSPVAGTPGAQLSAPEAGYGPPPGPPPDTVDATVSITALRPSSPGPAATASTMYAPTPLGAVVVPL